MASKKFLNIFEVNYRKDIVMPNSLSFKFFEAIFYEYIYIEQWVILSFAKSLKIMMLYNYIT